MDINRTKKIIAQYFPDVLVFMIIDYVSNQIYEIRNVTIESMERLLKTKLHEIHCCTYNNVYYFLVGQRYTRRYVLLGTLNFIDYRLLCNFYCGENNFVNGITFYKNSIIIPTKRYIIIFSIKSKQFRYIKIDMRYWSWDWNWRYYDSCENGCYIINDKVVVSLKNTKHISFSLRELFYKRYNGLYLEHRDELICDYNEPCYSKYCEYDHDINDCPHIKNGYHTSFPCMIYHISSHVVNYGKIFIENSDKEIKIFSLF